jgi:signal transduction histidine kinase
VDNPELPEDTIASIRDISADLHGSALDHAGLLVALQAYAHQFVRRTGIAVKVSGPALEPRLAAERERLCFASPRKRSRIACASVFLGVGCALSCSD